LGFHKFVVLEANLFGLTEKERETEMVEELAALNDVVAFDVRWVCGVVVFCVDDVRSAIAMFELERKRKSEISLGCQTQYLAR